MDNTGYHSRRSHKWLVLIAGVMVTWLNVGFIFAFGALFLSMLEQFGESRAKTATVQSLLVGVTMSFGVVSGIIITKTGLTKASFVGATLAPLGLLLSFFAESILTLDICIGVITGLGTSLMFISSAVAIGKAFTGPQRLLALTLHNSAIRLSGLTYPYLFKWLLSEVGFNGTMLIIGGIFLNTFPAAIIFASVDERTSCMKDRKPTLESRRDIEIIVTSKPTADNSVDLNSSDICDTDTQKNGSSTAIDQNSSNGNPENIVIEIKARKGETGLASLPYLCLIIGVAFTISVLNGYTGVALDVFRWKGYTDEQGLFSFLPLNISGLLSGIIPGFLKQRKGVNSILFAVVFSACGCLGQLVILLSKSYGVILLGVILTGQIGGVISAGSMAVINIVGLEKFSIGFGLIQTANGMMSAGTGPLFGLIRDGTSSYDIVLMSTAAVLLAGHAVFLLCMCLRRRDTKTSKT